MKKNRLLAVLLILIWVFLMFVMHLACFDIFEENNWYCYLIAIGSFLLQVLIINIITRLTKIRTICLICGILYAIAVVCPCSLWIVFSLDNLLPLIICCFCLNLLGVVSCLVFRFDYLLFKCPCCRKCLGHNVGNYCPYCGNYLENI